MTEFFTDLEPQTPSITDFFPSLTKFDRQVLRVQNSRTFGRVSCGLGECVCV